MIRTVDETLAVAPQITPDMLSDIAGLGFVSIVNNRPDDEEPGQPSGAEIEAAARAAGLAYHAIPVTQAGFSGNQLDAMVAALQEAKGPVLAFCRSGTRSCNLWALARAKLGDDPQALTEKAGIAGYNLANVRPLLDALSARS